MGLLGEAWDAVEAGRTVLAEKLARRAIDEGGFVNPRVWLEHGRVLWRCGHRAEAEESVCRALSLAPGYEAAAVALAEMTGTTRGPAEAGAADADPTGSPASSASLASTDRERDRPPVFTERTDRYDWDDVESRLRERGAATLPRLLAPPECDTIAAWFEDESLFEHLGGLDDDEAGRVEMRALAIPLPQLVADLRAELYGRAAVIARRFDEIVGRTPRWPASSAVFLERCDRAGYRRSTVVLLRLRENGFVGVRRDDAGAGWFPLGLLVALGRGGAPGAEGTRAAGVELEMMDLRHGKRRRARAVEVAPGDGVLFCNRERLVQVGGVFGLQPVAHGIKLSSGSSDSSGPPRLSLDLGFGGL